MADANQELFDAALRHQIGLRRVTAAELKSMNELLARSDRELLRLIRKRLGQENFTAQRLRELYKDIRQLRAEVLREIRVRTRDGLKRLSRAEQEFETRMLQAALPVQLEFAAASAATLNALVTQQPFSGGANAARTLSQWFESLGAADQRRLVGAIQQGVALEETVDQIVRRVRGTQGRGFQDGVLAATRRNAEAIVRTAVNHVSNASREAFWAANEEVIDYVRWNATLDGRTSATCRGRDGHNAPLSGKSFQGVPEPHLKPPTARPPAHPNCRSVLVAVLDGDGVNNLMGERPFVRDTRTRRFREKDFRADARASVGEKQWRQLSVGQRNALIREQRQAWTAANVGQVPADVDYDTWLRRQPTAFQNEVLGKQKAAAFRKGLKLDRYLDRQGNELTLVELKKLEPGYFP